MISINPKDIPTAKLHGYLLSAVAPRPIALASTVDKDGHPNLSPFSFFNVFSANPPILIFSPARRVHGNTTKHTLDNVHEVKEVVINIVNHAIVQQMSLSSTEYAKNVNEFDKAGFTMLKSDSVKPFRVAESPVQFECKVNEIISLGNQGGAGNLIICEVIKIHIQKHILNDDESINQHKIDLVARAGGSYYTRAKEGYFEIPKPIKTLGIGVDAIPKDIRNSEILTGNDLGLLGNIEKLPSQEDISSFLKQHSFSITNNAEKHKFAKKFLDQGDIISAWKTLLN